MRAFSRVLLFVLGFLLGSAATSDAVVYEVSWVDVRFEPDYSNFDHRFVASEVPVTITGSLTWDSAIQQFTAGFTPYPDPTVNFALFDPNYWTMTGAHSPLFYTWQWHAGTYNTLVGETGFGGIVEFLQLSAPSLFPDFIVGTYDAALTPDNHFKVINGVEAVTYLPVSGEIRVAAVPEFTGAMALGVIQLAGLWWLMNRRARTA
jgi:hypothetical protein